MRKYTTKQVKKLAQSQDYVIIIIDGAVYDVTSYINQHPGGKDILKSVSGTDATKQFNDVGHSMNALKRRQSFLIGQIDDSWGIFKWKWWYLPIVATVMYTIFSKSNLNKKSNKF